MVHKTRLYNWYICLVAAGCMVLMGYDASVFNGIQNSDNSHAYFDNPDSYMLGLMNTVYTIGGILTGWFLAVPLADYMGRRWAMGIGCFYTIIATLMQCFPPANNAVPVFMAGRVLIGCGQAFAIVRQLISAAAGPIYIGDVTPSYIRGLVMAFWQMFYSVGSFVAYWVNYAAGKHADTLGGWDWKMVVIFQVLLPAIIICQLPFMPESPRWFVQRKRDIEGARKVLQQVRDTDEEIENELATIREAIQYEREALDSGKKAYMTLLKDASARKRLLLTFGLNIGKQLTGQGTFNSYSSTIYKKVWTNGDTINLINALSATFGILFTLNAAWTVDRFGRKFLLIIGATGMAVCMLITALVGLETPETPEAAKTEPVVWIYTAEVFPMNVRVQAVGMCSQMQGVANTIFQQFFPIFYEKEGLKSFFFFMACNALLAVFVWFLIPETKKVPLEEIDTLFGGTSHVQRGAAMLHEQKLELEHVEQARGGKEDSEHAVT
ncbi:general substrate transporter [Aspergillus novoparasiticus]|uniref:General substrate transporter n=1 Tax=Aspergillus novoparasiticus TaxID=986946 RepID=A0A5N6EM32_9EURO|nr:general substrate transporter [Aspergillus novoparasiticus]